MIQINLHNNISIITNKVECRTFEYRKLLILLMDMQITVTSRHTGCEDWRDYGSQDTRHVETAAPHNMTQKYTAAPSLDRSTLCWLIHWENKNTCATSNLILCTYGETLIIAFFLLYYSSVNIFKQLVN